MVVDGTTLGNLKTRRDRFSFTEFCFEVVTRKSAEQIAHF